TRARDPPAPTPRPPYPRLKINSPTDIGAGRPQLSDRARRLVAAPAPSSLIPRQPHVVGPPRRHPPLHVVAEGDLSCFAIHHEVPIRVRGRRPTLDLLPSEPVVARSLPFPDLQVKLAQRSEEHTSELQSLTT